jgi:hypothetical protein
MSGAPRHPVWLTLPRVVLPEVLDGLAADDRAAQRSRRDLQRLHRAMGTRATLLRALRALPLMGTRSASPATLRVLELGAGDGSLMLGVARALQGNFPAVALTLLDRLPLLTAATAAEYALAGWTATAEVGDALAWASSACADRVAERPGPQVAPRWDLIVANLFLHHFKSKELAMLLAAVAGSSNHFVACEPRRAWLARAGSHLVGVLGANAVTREDAVLSVQAGFCDQELRAHWPVSTGWKLSEYPAGLFSHCIVASRGTGSAAGVR